uniref:Piwi domain-containing protein n=1 Tax=Panagrolaimus davidi TaxID=227884 RepID=A0A914PYZ8_9BILA
MNALSAGSSVNAMEFQRKRKKPPPVIDLPLSSPLDPVVITPTTTTASVAGTVPPPDPLGPDPTRVPAPSAHRRIHFADDKGDALVHTKFIENVLNNNAHRSNSDMLHADAEAEIILLKQMKTDVDVENEDEKMRMEMPEMGNTEVDSSWRLIPYYKNAQNQFSQDLIDEEEARHGNVMRTFVTQPAVLIEHPSEPDDVENAVTKFRESSQQSAYPLQGTAKLTNYEVISNEAKLSLRNDIQAFTHEICYTHQIVASAVSLPDEYLLPMNSLNGEEIIWLVIAMLPMSLAMMTASIV